MAYTTIDDPSEYFHTQLYAGDASGNAQNITNDANAGDFKPDWLWIKERTSTSNHMVMDSTRKGDYNRIMPNSSDAEITSDPAVLPLTDGFSVADSDGGLNQASQTYVAWQWKVNGGTTETAVTESGNNPANVRQTNTDAGFSIITYTGTGATGTIAHGLGVTPEWILFKARAGTENWPNYHVSTGNTHAVDLNRTVAEQDNDALFNDTSPTSSVFTVGSDSAINADGVAYVCYCFAPIQGYSKFGSFVGNGNTNGPFIYLGFKPAWILYKRATDGTNNWGLIDNKRDTHNPCIRAFSVNLNNAIGEQSANGAGDMLSNGWKIGASAGSRNANGVQYIYIAFAESPFVTSTGVPTTAR